MFLQISTVTSEGSLNYNKLILFYFSSNPPVNSSTTAKKIKQLENSTKLLKYLSSCETKLSILAAQLSLPVGTRVRPGQHRNGLKTESLSDRTRGIKWNTMGICVR